MDKTYLTVPFKEKDQAKNLGARWDGDARKWYVPDGFDIAPFSQWLDAMPARNLSLEATPNMPSETDKGIRLAVLLSRISQAVVAALPNAEWVMAEIGALQERQQNIYLDLVEHDSEGKEIAKTRGTVWKSVAGKLLAKFKEGTGADLAAGIKVMVKVQAQFNGQYGLSLNIIDIDPSYTMGDMAAKLRRIRESLLKEGIFGANRALAMPSDFFRVAIISPEQAAGLSDFKQEANLLAEHGICQFDYYGAVFQGERAGTEILQSIGKALAMHETKPYDALVIIRGGGNVADLNWLNNEALARQICLSPLPVLAGIGHSTDSTILDEVACHSFDTPSKVIGHIVQTVASVTNTAQSHAEEILRGAEKLLFLAEQKMESDWRETRANAGHMLEQAKQQAEHSHAWVVHTAVNLAETAGQTMDRAFESVSSSAQGVIMQADVEIESLHQAVGHSIASIMDRTEQAATEFFNTTVMQTESLLDRASRDSAALMEETIRAAQKQADRAEEASRETISQIIALGPMHTLTRGFAIVRSEQGGVVTSAARARDNRHLEIQFADGSIKVIQEEQ
jgi:exodeoxyribonuclease VII large subunit